MEHTVHHSSALIPIIVFLVVYIAITFELANKAAAALTGVGVLVVLHVLTEHQAVGFIDFETLMLLTGMMILVSLIKQSGFFTIVSVRIAEFTKGNPIKILCLFSVITALMSAFLDNVTTVLIVIPIIIELTTSAPICRIEALGQGRGGWTHDLQRTDYSVEVSMDGKNWTKVVNQKGITSEDGLQILDFDPIPSKWIKIGIEGEKYKRNQITAGLSRIQIYSPR